MVFDLNRRLGRKWAAKTTILLSVVFFFMCSAEDASAQRKFSRSYPTGRAVRLTLTNKTGTVTVVGWERNEINISATMEAPSAAIIPQNQSGDIVINLLRDNPERETGPVNFTIYVPYTTEVNIDTRLGNLVVSNIHSTFVRAHITTDGDITLMNMGVSNVVAESTSGDIVYDGALKDGGTYRFSSMMGKIHLRIPFTSSFKLMATAPSSRSISLGQFSNDDMNIVGDGRRIIGKFGTGSAILNVTTQRGQIFFIRR